MPPFELATGAAFKVGEKKDTSRAWLMSLLPQLGIEDMNRGLTTPRNQLVLACSFLMVPTGVWGLLLSWL